jgi:protein tyrosine phosphatase
MLYKHNTALTNSEVSVLVPLNYKFHYIFLSVDHTRVKLKDVEPNVPGAEYINANYIKVIRTVIIRAASYRAFV